MVSPRTVELLHKDTLLKELAVLPTDFSDSVDTSAALVPAPAPAEASASSRSGSRPSSAAGRPSSAGWRPSSAGSGQPSRRTSREADEFAAAACAPATAAR